MAEDSPLVQYEYLPDTYVLTAGDGHQERCAEVELQQQLGAQVWPRTRKGPERGRITFTSDQPVERLQQLQCAERLYVLVGAVNSLEVGATLDGAIEHLRRMPWRAAVQEWSSKARLCRAPSTLRVVARRSGCWAGCSSMDLAKVTAGCVHTCSHKGSCNVFSCAAASCVSSCLTEHLP